MLKTSNYSMANINDFNKPINSKCQYQTPHYWANCYGARCVVIHQGHGTVKNAVTCACPVFKNTTFVIGSPSVSYCGPHNGEIWSAIRNIGKDSPIVPLYKQLYPTSPPVSLLKK